MPATATISAPNDLVLPQGTFRLSLPNWGRWLDILDRAARGQDSADRADPDRLLQAWLSATATQANANGLFAPIKRIGDLPASVADQLMAAGTDALDAARIGDDVRMSETDEAFEIQSKSGSFTLRPLTFSERNSCLQGALALTADGPQINASQYDLALVARSTTLSENGEKVSIPTLRELPLPLGEALITAARKLSDPVAETELAAFASAGLSHPDLELATLCLTFGITPEQAEALPAAKAKRLNAAARLLAASAPNVAPQAAALPDNVTQIVINDD